MILEKLSKLEGFNEIKPEITKLLGNLLNIGKRIGAERTSCIFNEREFTNDKVKGLETIASLLIGE